MPGAFAAPPERSAVVFFVSSLDNKAGLSHVLCHGTVVAAFLLQDALILCKMATGVIPAVVDFDAAWDMAWQVRVVDCDSPRRRLCKPEAWFLVVVIVLVVSGKRLFGRLFHGRKESRHCGGEA